MKIDGTYVIKGRGLTIVGVPFNDEEPFEVNQKITIEAWITGIEGCDWNDQIGLVLRALEIKRCP